MFEKAAHDFERLCGGFPAHIYTKLLEAPYQKAILEEFDNDVAYYAPALRRAWAVAIPQREKKDGAASYRVRSIMTTSHKEWAVSNPYTVYRCIFDSSPLTLVEACAYLKDLEARWLKDGVSGERVFVARKQPFSGRHYSRVMAADIR